MPGSGVELKAENGIFKVALTGDFVASDGRLYFDPAAMEALSSLPGVSVEILDSGVGVPLSADVLRSFDAVITKRSPVPAESLEIDDLRAIHVSRNGVGVEHLDLDACARAGVIVTNTPDAVRRTMASSAMAMILALAHRLVEKDRATRAGRWSDRHRFKGAGLSGRVLGVVGAGNIGADLLRLAAPWGMKRLISHPSLDTGRANAMDAEKVELNELLVRSDFVVLCCPLTEQTRKMIDARALKLMRPGALIVNIARGGLIDEAALIGALEDGRIAGAALDVFDPEPPCADNPLFRFDNVIVTSHNIGFSDEGNRLGNTLAVEAVKCVAAGSSPPNIVNPKVLDHPRLGFMSRE